MSLRRYVALAAIAGLVFVLAACGGGGGKKTATSTPKKTSSAARTVTPAATGASNATPDAAATSSSGNGGSTPAETNTPRPTVPHITGTTTTYRVTLTVASDPGHLQQLVEARARPVTRLIITVGNGQISVDAPQPFIKVTGTIDGAGNFTASSSGKVDPYDGVDVTFTGSISAAGAITGTYTYGSNGVLPGGQPISYSVTGTTLIPTTPGG